MVELPDTLTGLQQALARGELSSTESLTAQRNRLKELDKKVHAVIALLPAQGKPASAGSLAGIGLAHKDIFNTAGRMPGLGRDKGSAAPGLQAATVIQRLAGQGAAHMAALTMAEYACGATGDNSHFGRCINPLHADAVVGGSSSGSAAAVAAHMAYGSLGTDTAGSVRMPAATCGLAGLKTTHGLLPTDGVFPLSPSLDNVGILARNPADATQILLAGATHGRLRPPAGTSPRIKAWIPETGLHASLALAMEDFSKQHKIGTRISECAQHATLTHLSEIVLHVESARTHRTALLEGTSPAAVNAVAMAGLVIPVEWYVAAINARAQRARDFVAQHLTAHDIFMLPALSAPVPDWDQVTPGHASFDAMQLLGMHRYMGFANYLGLPSLVVPIARDARGLPISVQLMGRPFHELTLLKFAQDIGLPHFKNDSATLSFSPKD